MNDYKYFFEDPENLAALRREVLSWVGTPYKHHTGVKQRGCDCVHLVINSYKEVGANKGKVIHIPKYAPDWHMHRGVPLLVEGLTKQFDVDEIELDPDLLIDGDVVLFKWGKQTAHSGLYLNGQVYQALNDMRVEPRALRDLEFYERMTHILRILK